jgi:tape measure domain-containing protein
MATLADLNVVIGAEIDGFEAAMNRVQQGIGRVGDYAKQAGQTLSTYVTLPLAALAAGAITAAAKVDSLTRGLQAVTQQQLGEQGVTGLQGIAQAATDTQQRLKELREVAKLPGLGFTEAIQGDIRLRAVGLSADLSKKALLAFGNAIATTGGGKSELDRVTVQLGQLSAKGKVLAQDLRPIIEAAPAVATALRKLYNTVDSETISKSLEAQGKSSTDFIATLTDELAKLPKVTGGLAIAGENISDSLTLAGSKVGLIADKLFDLSGVANRAGEFLEGLADKFAVLDPGTQKLIFGLGAAAAAAGPIVFGLGAIAAAIPSVVAGFEVLGLASTAALGPIGIGVAAIAAGAVLIIENWGDLVTYFSSSGEGGRVFTDLVDSIENSIAQISAAFSSLNGGGDFAGLVSASGILKAAFRDVAVGITAVSNVIGGTVGAIVKLLSGDLPGAADEATRALVGLAQPLANVLGFQLRLSETSDGVRKGFEGAAFGGGVFGDSLLQVSGILTGFNTQLQGFAGGLPQYGASLAAQSGLLETLRKRLEEVKDAREKEATAAAIAVDNKLIDGIQKQIDALLGVDKGAKAATDALTKLRENLRDNGNASRALGADYDYNGNRAKILEAGVKSLTDAGFAPGGKVVQDYVRQLRAVPEALDQIAIRTAKGTEEVFATPDFVVPQADFGELPELNLNYESMFSAAAASVVKGGGQVTDAFDKFGQKLTESQLAALDGQRDFNTGFGQLVENLNESIGPLIASFAVQFGDALGAVVTGSASVGDAIAGLLGGILESIGGFMSQFGAQLIALGIGKQAFDTLFEAPGTGPLAIAAGIGLVALGGIVSAVGKSAAASARSVSSGGSALSSQPSTNYNAGGSNGTQKLVIEAVFTLRGKDLVAVGRVADYRSLRTN